MNIASIYKELKDLSFEDAIDKTLEYDSSFYFDIDSRSRCIIIRKDNISIKMDYNISGGFVNAYSPDVDDPEITKIGFDDGE